MIKLKKLNFVSLYMLDSSKFVEKFLQNRRFKKARPFLIGDVLDFGGNQGELKKFVKGNYLVVNNDHAPLTNAHCDTIVCLAVIEHLDQAEVFKVFNEFKNILNENGRIFLTTPTKAAKSVLEFMAFFRIVDKENIKEHKHYWSKNEIYALAETTGLILEKYEKFQLGYNQLAVLKHK